MNAIQGKINGIIIFEPVIFNDSRGFFFESYSKERYKSAGIEYEFLQDNISYSVKHTIRGLHFQTGKYAQGKLCMVPVGEVIDVAVDLRKDSPTFGKYEKVILSGENKKQLWIPPGFAHGFEVLSDHALFLYKCTSYYNKESEKCLKFDDMDINIKWETQTPLISPKDAEGISFAEIKEIL